MTVAVPAPTVAQPKAFTRGLNQLKNRVDSIRQAISSDSSKAASALDQLRNDLLSDGFDPRLASEIIASRGAVRRPLPVRSARMTALNAPHAPVMSASPSLATAESP